MTKSTGSITRRRVLQGAAASGLAGATLMTTARPAVVTPKPIRLGLVQPQTGPLAFFTDNMPFVLDQLKRQLGGQVTIGGTARPYEIVIRDSQSDPNRASEVAQDLIFREKIDLMLTYATPETVNPVSDQCELNGVPCISNDAPLEPYFFGRRGDPNKGFEWTYHFFFSGQELIEAMVPYWNRLSTNKVVGGLWPNDGDGLAQSKAFPNFLTQHGFKPVDPGRFDMPVSNYNAQIAAFKAANVEIVQGVLPPPEFTTFWNGCAQQGYKPKIVYVGKACEFPEAMYPLGTRAERLSVEVWWSKYHPFHSGLTGQSSQALADDYEKASNKQWELSLGFRHSLFEVAFDVLKRTQDLGKAESIRDAVRATDYKSIVGTIDFRKGPLPNCALTPLVVGQWRKGNKFPLELILVDNSTAAEIPVQGAPEEIRYS
jgi:branched-chain amino acid transport system substrate-binding protein